MNSRAGRFWEVIMTLLLLSIGIGLVYGSAFDPAIGLKISDAVKIPVVGVVTGVVLVLSVVLRWISGIGKRKDTFIDFEAEDGNVGISTRAVSDFVERVGREFAAVRHIDSKLIQGKDMLDIDLNVKVVSGNKIPELSQVLQKRIRESVRESLGLDEIRNISIKIQEIVGEPMPAEETADQ